MGLNSFERDQVQHEIEWIKNKIKELTPLAARKTSMVRHINDLKRQISEREVTLAFNERAGRK